MHKLWVALVYSVHNKTVACVRFVHKSLLTHMPLVSGVRNNVVSALIMQRVIDRLCALISLDFNPLSINLYTIYTGLIKATMKLFNFQYIMFISLIPEGAHAV